MTISRRAFLITIPAALPFVSGCAAAMIGAGAAGGAGGLALLEYVEGSAITEDIIGIAGKEAAQWGLSKLPMADQQPVAKALVAACTDAITYLQSGVLPTADIINQIVSQNFKNLHPAVLAEIQYAAWVLGKFVPTAAVILSTAQVADLIAFLSGIQGGAQTFIANPTMQIKQKYTKRGKHVDRADAYPDWFGA